ncbi:MAG TPA: hypothetical protein VJV78_41950 [Polyangiales bacterium]|nr:hypothetical protein [Polyangiales bacterium]
MCGGGHHPWLVFGLTGFILATATSAQAQQWLSDRKRAEGSGLRVGDLEIHPGLGAEFGYTSNVYNAEKGAELGSPELRIAPHVFLSTLSEQRTEGPDGQRTPPGMLKFKGGLSASLMHYFADDTPGTDIGANLDLNLTIAPDRPFSFALLENFSRYDKPFSDPATEPGVGGVQAAPNVNYAYYTEMAGARLLAQTRGGLLKGGLGYRFNYTFYEDDAFLTNNNLTHSVDLTGAWEFLPKTALFYDAVYSHQDYTKNGDPGVTTNARLIDNDQLSARLGFNGAITPRISATLAAGYAVGFFKGNDYEGVILNAEGRWTPSEVSEWALGYERAFQSAYEGNFVLRNQIYTRLRFFFGGAFVLASKLGVEFLDFGPDPTQMDRARDDIRYSADVSGEYRFVDWLAATFQLVALIDDTDFVYENEVPDPTPTDPDRVTTLEDPAEFKTFEAWIGLRAFY